MTAWWLWHFLCLRQCQTGRRRHDVLNLPVCSSVTKLANRIFWKRVTPFWRQFVQVVQGARHETTNFWGHGSKVKVTQGRLCTVPQKENFLTNQVVKRILKTGPHLPCKGINKRQVAYFFETVDTDAWRRRCSDPLGSSIFSRFYFSKL